MFTQMELITLELACHLAIKDVKTTLEKIDPIRVANEVFNFKNLIKKIDSLRQ